ncbi:IS66 family insertion sequence element accessory protein TnpA [Arsenophonus sp. PmNCSU2021_1]|uniref:IS66 family insertion sequence element accessory protein TnpA n=1 Tax=Arsenophonus sp. PmNCSU2021_1 TaxID=3118989 RepID=UPI003FA524B2
MGVYRTDDEWRAIIEAQQCSGLNPTQYCRQNTITFNTPVIIGITLMEITE